MNVQRGLFRLWVIFSAIFIAAVIGLTAFTMDWHNFSKPAAITTGAADSVGPNSSLQQANEVLQNALLKYYPDRAGAIVKITTFHVHMPDGSVYEVNTPDSNEKITTVPSYPPFWIILLRITAFALGVPLIILLLGRSCMWVFAGFKSSK